MHTPGCWSGIGCNKDHLKVHGRCDKCDGPNGEIGYCCRGDGGSSGCTKELLLNTMLLGYSNRHVCINHRDVDECALGTHDCDVNAYCTDTHPSFKCTCMAGYKGDGKTCEG